MEAMSTASTLLHTVVKAGASRQVVAATTCALLRALTDGQLADFDLAERTNVVAEAMQAHGSLTTLVGPRHNLGTATVAADQAGLLTQNESKALRAVRRKANRAKHVWETPEPASTRAAEEGSYQMEQPSPTAVVAPAQAEEPHTNEQQWEDYWLLRERAFHTKETLRLEENIIEQQTSVTRLHELLEQAREDQETMKSECEQLRVQLADRLTKEASMEAAAEDMRAQLLHANSELEKKTLADSSGGDCVATHSEDCDQSAVEDPDHTIVDTLGEGLFAKGGFSSRRAAAEHVLIIQGYDRETVARVLGRLPHLK